jgi:hypothetical protein
MDVLGARLVVVWANPGSCDDQLPPLTTFRRPEKAYVAFLDARRHLGFNNFHYYGD